VRPTREIIEAGGSCGRGGSCGGGEFNLWLAIIANGEVRASDGRRAKYHVPELDQALKGAIFVMEPMIVDVGKLLARPV
jgi:hypothetical protein